MCEELVPNPQHVKNWYQIITHMNNWYLIVADVLDRNCEELESNAKCMRGSRKFCQRGSSSDLVFFIYFFLGGWGGGKEGEKI